jgi:hypothetical protein
METSKHEELPKYVLDDVRPGIATDSNQHNKPPPEAAVKSQKRGYYMHLN